MTNKKRVNRSARQAAPINWLKLSPSQRTIHVLQKRFGEMRDSDLFYDSVDHYDGDLLTIAREMFNGPNSPVRFFVTLDASVVHTKTEAGVSFSTVQTFTLWLVPSDFKVTWLKRGVECPNDEKDSIRCQIPIDQKMLVVTKRSAMAGVIKYKKTLSHDHEVSKYPSLSHVLANGKLTIFRSTPDLVELLRSERAFKISEVHLRGGGGNITAAVVSIQLLHALGVTIQVHKAISAGIYYLSLPHVILPSVELASHGFRCDMDDDYETYAETILNWIDQELPPSPSGRSIIASERHFSRLSKTLKSLRSLSPQSLHKIWYSIDPTTLRITGITARISM